MMRCDISRLHCDGSANHSILKKLSYLVAFDKTVIQSLAFCTQGCVTLLGPHESRMQIVKTLLEALKPCLAAVQDGFSGSAGLGDAGLMLGRRERVSVYQCVS